MHVVLLLNPKLRRKASPLGSRKATSGVVGRGFTSEPWAGTALPCPGGSQQGAGTGPRKSSWKPV